jgi:hypothetical protein
MGSLEMLVTLYQIVHGVASQMGNNVSILDDDIVVVGWFAGTLRDLVIVILR